MFRRTALVLIAAAGLALTGLETARAQVLEPGWIMPQGGAFGRGPRDDRPRQEERENREARVLPLRTLIGIVSSSRPGRFVDVVGGLDERGGRLSYVFRWRYPDGAEENLRVDAGSGQVFGR